MIREELEEILRELGQHGAESSGVEAKRAGEGLPQRLWETISAFSNTPGGGVLLLGVDEAVGFRVSGVNNAAKLQADLVSLCSDQMLPVLRPLVQIWEVEGKSVISAEFPELPPDEKPCYYRGGGLPNGAFVRVGDSDRKLSPYEVQALFESRGQPRHDAERVEGALPEDLEPRLLEPILSRLRERHPYSSWTDDRILRTLHILVVDPDGRVAPSLAGWLCFSAYPQDRFPSLCVTFTRYPTPVPGESGPAGERFLDNVRIEGPLPEVVLGTMAALKRNMQRRGIVQGLYREDLWEYPETVLREALVNALGHRDYSPQARGAHVRVEMFPDRLGISSPGGLFGPIQADQLGGVGVQSSRNAYLMRILEELPPRGERRPLCENRGTGLVSILEQLRRAGMSPPRFDVSLTGFRLVLPNHTLYDPDTLRWLESVGSEGFLTATQRQALAFLRHSATLTNAEYCRVSGVDSRVATRELASLVERGIIERRGTGRWSSYVLAGQSPSERAPRVDEGGRGRRISRGDILDALRGTDALSAQGLARRLGVSAAAIRYWLPRLVSEGLIERTEESSTSPRMRYRATSGIQREPPKRVTR